MLPRGRVHRPTRPALGARASSSPPGGCARVARPTCVAPGDTACGRASANDGVAARPRRRRRAARRSSTCAATAATSCCRAARSDEARARSTARTTAGSTTSTARCARRRASTRRPASTPPSTGSSACAVEEWHGWVFVNVSGDAGRRSRDWIGGLDELVAPYEPRAARRRRDARVRRWRRTGSSRSRTTTSATTARDPPGALPVSPPTSGENFDLPRRVVRRHDGADAARGDDVARRGRARGRFLPGLDATRSGDSAVRRASSRTCCSACTPTT